MSCVRINIKNHYIFEKKKILVHRYLSEMIYFHLKESDYIDKVNIMKIIL